MKGLMFLTKSKFTQFLFSVILICILIAVTASIWGRDSIASMAHMSGIGIMALLTVLKLWEKENRAEILLWTIIVLLSFIVVITGEGGGGFSYLRKWIFFVSTINLYYWVYSTDITFNMINKVFRCGILLSVIFIIGYAAGRGYTTETEFSKKMFTLHLSNPNFTGMCALDIFLCTFIAVDFTKRKMLKLLYLTLSVVMLYFIWLTEARGSIIAALLFIILKFVPGKKYNKHITFWVIIFPLVFAILYMELINNKDIMEFFEFAVSEGKSLSSREEIWTVAIDIIKENFVFGNYFLSTGGTGQGQLHNIHLDTLAAYGIIVFVFQIIFMNRIVNNIGKEIKTSYQMTGMLAFYAVIISGTFEAGLFSGSLGIYVFFGGFLMLAKYQK